MKEYIGDNVGILSNNEDDEISKMLTTSILLSSLFSAIRRFYYFRAGYQKNVFGLFRFLLMAILSKMQMHEDPFFFEPPSILNIHTKYDIKVERRQLAFNYGMRNPRSGEDGKEENDGMLILRIVTVKYPVVWSTVGATTIESTPNNFYFIHVIIMIGLVACIPFPVNI